MASNAEKDYKKVYKELRAQGACKLCSYRFLCNAEFSSLSEEFLGSQGYEDPPNAKVKKNNGCVICLGLFESEVIEKAKKRVMEEVTMNDFDCRTYMLALVIPISCKLREHSTFVFLKQQFQDLYKDCPYSPRLGVKETWRHLHCPAISNMIGKQLDAKSELSVQIEFTYVDERKDCAPIKPVIKEQATKHKVGVTCCMKLMNETDFGKLYPFPMAVPNEFVGVKSVTIKRDSIFMAGNEKI